MLNETLQPIVESLEKSLTTRQVFGEPLDVAGATLIPVMDLMFGFGGGSGGHPTNGNGGGGGGGARLAPKALVSIVNGNVVVHPLKSGALDRIVDAVPALLDRIMEANPKLAERLAHKPAEQASAGESAK